MFPTGSLSLKANSGMKRLNSLCRASKAYSKPAVVSSLLAKSSTQKHYISLPDMSSDSNEVAYIIVEYKESNDIQRSTLSSYSLTAICSD